MQLYERIAAKGLSFSFFINVVVTNEEHCVAGPYTEVKRNLTEVFTDCSAAWSFNSSRRGRLMDKYFIHPESNSASQLHKRSSARNALKINVRFKVSSHIQTLSMGLLPKWHFMNMWNIVSITTSGCEVTWSSASEQFSKLLCFVSLWPQAIVDSGCWCQGLAD